jgi:hypothetical protein
MSNLLCHSREHSTDTHCCPATRGKVASAGYSFCLSSGTRSAIALARGCRVIAVSSGGFNSALLGLRVVWWEWDGQIGEIDWLVAGLAAAGPALEDRLHQQHGLRECQAGRG